MKRRDALKALAAIGLTPTVGSANEAHFGAIRGNDRKTRPIRKNHPWIRGAGKDSNVFLWKFLEHTTGGPYVPHYQFKDGQGIGDCVAQAVAGAVNCLMATEIVLHKELEEWKALASIEAIYGGGRVEVGMNRYEWEPSSSNGCVGVWALEFIKDWGVLHQLKYGDTDLSGYSIPRSQKWAFDGVPDELEDIARQHPVQQFSKVSNFDDLSDALAGGQPVVIGSTYAVKETRDQDGFGSLYTGGDRFWDRRRRRWFQTADRKKWYHEMFFAGIRNETERPGALLVNSHGSDWITGPKSFGQPDGTCWLSPDECDLMLKDWDEGYAISAYKGHPADRIDEIKRKHKLF